MPSASPPHPPAPVRLPWTSYVDLVRTRAESQPERLAVYGLLRLAEPGPRWSWRELDRRTRSLAALLQSAGAAGQPVVILQENDPTYLASFLACAYAGAVAVPMPPLAHARHLARLVRVMQDCGATRLLTTRELAARCRPELGDSLRWLCVEDAVDGDAAAWADHYPAGADVAFLQYTSGSTSAPKGVVVRHADLIFQGESIGRSLSLTPEDRGLCWMPLFHDLGLIVGALQALYTGYPLALASPAAFVKAPERWLQAVSDHRITFSGGSNFAYDLCAEVVDPAALPGLDLSCWALAMNAAEPVRAGTIDRFVARFGPYGFAPETMEPAYGLAEATVGVSATPRHGGPRRRRVDPAALAAGRVVDSTAPDARELVSSGPALAGITVVAVDPDGGTPLGPDRVGELCSSCEHFPERYLGLENPEVFDLRIDGRRFLRTGDLGFVDAAGWLTITGRRKDVIIVAGKNHYPQDLEGTAEEACPALRRNFVAAFSVDTGGGEGVVLVAEVRGDATAEELAAAPARVRKAIQEHHELGLVELLLATPGQLPKTTSGKLQRARCRELWTQGRFERAR